jgi:hypothetical protein
MQLFVIARKGGRAGARRAMAKMGIAMPKYCENRHRSARFSDAALNALAQPQGGRVRGARGWGKRAAV